MKGENLSPKVKALYDAMEALMSEEMDIKDIKVSDITSRAGIGKGTAYEYFKNKEEIISSALLYQIDQICRLVVEKAEKLNSFSKTVHYILNCMDEEIKKRDCFIKFVHLISDNSPISKMLQMKIIERNTEVCMPGDVIERIIQLGIENGDIKSGLPKSYMRMEISSKFILYMIYLTDRSGEKECSKTQMHKMICDSLMKEFN